jgi:hypothetical protein
MRNIFFALFAILLVTLSCQKEIDLKLKDTEPQFVITGAVTLGDSVHTLKISKSVPFNQENVFPEVSGALVSMTDDLGNTYNFSPSKPGEYVLNTKDLSANRIYKIKVEAEGKTFVAEGKMPELVPLVTVFNIPNNFFGSQGNLLVPGYQDPEGIRNYYSFYYEDFTNDIDKRKTRAIYREDDITDGQVNQQPLFEGFNVDIGDTIRFEMYGITAEMFKYYFSKDQNTDPNSGAPANPVTNWSNKALGYFSVRNKQELVFVVK